MCAAAADKKMGDDHSQHPSSSSLEGNVVFPKPLQHKREAESRRNLLLLKHAQHGSAVAIPVMSDADAEPERKKRCSTCLQS
jgi:hypothetical protein